MSKNYIQIEGECKHCTLYSQCETNKLGVKSFLGKLKIYCKDGKRVAISE